MPHGAMSKYAEQCSAKWKVMFYVNSNELLAQNSSFY